MSDRYDTTSNVEGQYQQGSGASVLKNKLGIVDPAEMNQVELELLEDLTLALLDEIEVDQQLDILDICDWHRRWMGTVYDWAGEYRTVNMSKDGFPFAASRLIPVLMETFNDKFLSSLTPCDRMSDDELIEALAVVHVEFILIHPFRKAMAGSHACSPLLWRCRQVNHFLTSLPSMNRRMPTLLRFRPEWTTWIR